MLRQAFKEWAVICHALAGGRQALILRKGGLLEIDGGFRVEHPRFWLFPTYLHQQADGIVPEARDTLERVQADQPPADVIHFHHWAEVTAVHQVTDEARALALEGLHWWAPATVRSRFQYHRPGLFMLTVRVYRAPQGHTAANLAAYEGCKTWVELEQALPTAGSEPVLEEEAFAHQAAAIRARLTA
jgi:hypothetical protein